MPVPSNNVLYYAGVVILIGGLIIGVALALRARREAREGVDLTSEAEMISEFQRARDAGEMDEAEFRRVRDLLISSKAPKAEERHHAGPGAGLEARPPTDPPPKFPAPTDPG